MDINLKRLSFRQLARLADALCSQIERTNSPTAAFTLVRVEVEVDRRIALTRR